MELYRFPGKGNGDAGENGSSQSRLSPGGAFANEKSPAKKRGANGTQPKIKRPQKKEKASKKRGPCNSEKIGES